MNKEFFDLIQSSSHKRRAEILQEESKAQIADISKKISAAASAGKFAVCVGNNHYAVNELTARQLLDSGFKVERTENDNSLWVLWQK